MAHLNSQDNDASIRANLDLLEETKEIVSLKTIARQRQVTQYYNKRVKIRRFEEGDVVLKTCQASRLARELKKLSHNWEGPYLVSVIVGQETYKLQHNDGNEISRTWNA